MTDKEQVHEYMRAMKDEERQQAEKCYAMLKERGVKVCAGCRNDYVCQMGKDTSDWLFGVFLPAIDPSGQAFGYPGREQ